MSKKRNRTFVGVLGIIIAILGLIGVLPISLKSNSIFGLSLGTLLVIGGILLFAWSVTD